MLMDVHQRGNLRFPQSLPEFQRLFPDDAACAGYLEKARWSDGFVCPHCQAAGEPFRFANRPGVLRCRRCRRDTPLSSASTGGSIRSTPSVFCSASRATSPHRPTQSFTPEPGSTLHVGGVGNNRIGKPQSPVEAGDLKRERFFADEFADEARRWRALHFASESTRRTRRPATRLVCLLTPSLSAPVTSKKRFPAYPRVSRKNILNRCNCVLHILSRVTNSSYHP